MLRYFDKYLEQDVQLYFVKYRMLMYIMFQKYKLYQNVVLSKIKQY